jgi:hypothetical protein
MLPLAGFVAAVVGVIAAVAYWSLRASGSHDDADDYEEPGVAETGRARRPVAGKNAEPDPAERAADRAGQRRMRAGGRPAEANMGQRSGGQEANGQRVNAQRVNGLQVNGQRVNGLQVNGQRAPGWKVTGQRPPGRQVTGPRAKAARPGADQRPPAARARTDRQATAEGTDRPAAPAGAGMSAGWQPAAEQEQFTPPDGVRTERQGDSVAKSRPRFGLADRVGWRRRTDIDAEMWPEESFGGVSDEQFWDDLASDKPLATTARTAQAAQAAQSAQPEVGAARPRPRPADRRPGERLAEIRPADRTADQPVQPSGPQPIQAVTQAFPAATQAYPASAGHHAQATGSQPARAITQPQLAQSSQLPPSPQPPSPQLTQPSQQFQSPRAAAQPPSLPPGSGSSYPAAQASPTPAGQAYPATQYAGPPQGRGRHSSGEDPLTSAAYSMRSSGSVDGRSYQASRRARELTRDQYEAAISQETQTFSVTDAEATPSGGYPGSNSQFRPELPSGGAGTSGAPGIGSAGNGRTPGAHRSGRRDARDGYGSTGAYPYSYGQPGQAAPSSHTPPRGESYGNDSGWTDSGWTDRGRTDSGWNDGGRTDDGADDPRWGSGARDYGRPAPAPAVKGSRPDNGRGERHAYQGGYPGRYNPRGTDRR